MIGCVGAPIIGLSIRSMQTACVWLPIGNLKAHGSVMRLYTYPIGGFQLGMLALSQ